MNYKVEIAVANVPINTFTYVPVTLNQDKTLVHYFAHSQTALFQGWILVYRGALTAYNASNDLVAMFIERWGYYTAGAAYYFYGPLSAQHVLNVPLPAGVYTFAIYNSVAITNLRAIFELI